MEGRLSEASRFRCQEAYACLHMLAQATPRLQTLCVACPMCIRFAMYIEMYHSQSLNYAFKIRPTVIMYIIIILYMHVINGTAQNF